MPSISAISVDASGWVSAIEVSDDVFTQIALSSEYFNSYDGGSIQVLTGKHNCIGDWSMTKPPFGTAWILVATAEPQPNTLRRMIGPEVDLTYENNL